MSKAEEKSGHELPTHGLFSVARVAAHLLDRVAVNLVVCELRVVAQAAGDPLAAALGAHMTLAAVMLACHFAWIG